MIILFEAEFHQKKGTPFSNLFFPDFFFSSLFSRFVFSILVQSFVYQNRMEALCSKGNRSFNSSNQQETQAYSLFEAFGIIVDQTVAMAAPMNANETIPAAGIVPAD